MLNESISSHNNFNRNKSNNISTRGKQSRIIMTIIRKSYRIDAIKNRRSHRIAIKSAVFLQSAKHNISRKRHARHSSKQKTIFISDQKLSKTLRSRKIIFKDVSRKTTKKQERKHLLALKTPERKIQISQKVPPLQRSPRRSQVEKVSNEILHKDILNNTTCSKNQESKHILTLKTPQRKVKVSLVIPPLQRSPRHSQVKLSLQRSPHRNLFMD